MTGNLETIVVQTISTYELRTKLERKERFEFWNVLTDDYYSNENIVGSRHVPLDRIGREVARLGLNKQTEIIVYCSGPECLLSSFAYEKLLRLGYLNVKVYAGGLDAWESAGLRIDRYQSLFIPELLEPIAVRLHY